MKNGLCITLMLVALASVVPLQRWIDAKRGVGSAVEEALYLNSGTGLRRASLGFEGILADLYWLRTIQYFGDKSLQQKAETLNIGNVKNWKLNLLEPLIRITTDLDPQYIAAYRFGALFLPDINPEASIQLIQRAIRDNPQSWQLYQDLGFIYWKQKRFTEASTAYLQGSKVSGAPRWMEQLSGVMLAKGGDRETARQIFQRLYENTDDPTVRKTALNRLQYYQGEDEITFLNNLLKSYQAQRASCPNSLVNLMRTLQGNALQRIRQAGLNVDESLQPIDPHGFGYVLDVQQCTVTFASDSTLPKWKD